MKFLLEKREDPFDFPMGFKCNCGLIFGANKAYIGSNIPPEPGVWSCKCPDCGQIVYEDERLSDEIYDGEYTEEMEENYAELDKEETEVSLKTGKHSESAPEDPTLPVSKWELHQILRNCLRIEQLKECDDADSRLNRHHLINGLRYLISHTPNMDFRKLSSSMSQELYDFRCKYRESEVELSDEDAQQLASMSIPKYYKEIMAAYSELEPEIGLVDDYPDLYQDKELMEAHPELEFSVDNDEDMFAPSKNF